MEEEGKGLTRSQRRQIVTLTRGWLERAEVLMGQEFAPVQVRFDLCGAAAGQYRIHPAPCIRYNAALAARQFEDFCARTPPHEVAHHVVAQLHGHCGARPHGPEWRAVMRRFGLQPERCHDYDLSGLQVHRHRRFHYRCDCGTHALSATRHNRVQRGERSYFCRRCGKRLRPC